MEARRFAQLRRDIWRPEVSDVAIAAAAERIATDAFPGEIRGWSGAGPHGAVYDAVLGTDRVALKWVGPDVLDAVPRPPVHPNLCREIARGVAWVAVEWVEGDDLSVGCTVPRLAAVALQAIGGLRALHAAGLTHGNLRSSNVRTTPSGRTVLLDAGLAGPSTAADDARALRRLLAAADPSGALADACARLDALDLHGAAEVLREFAAGSGRYEPRDRLGAGGMGEVWRVHDRHLDRDVAMKVVAADRSDDPRLVARFVEEARITGRLQHPGVVPVHEVGVGPDGRPYFTMPVVGGRTLHDAIRDLHAGDGNLRRLVEAFARVCDTVAYAHANGIVHRDLKPSNLMLGAFGEVLVLDWGLAGRAGEARELAGTPRYMAPELLTERVPPYPLRIDVYALGATLYELLCGRPPYAEASEHVVLERIVAISPGPLPSGVPEELAEICAAAMCRDPAQRLAHAGEIGARIREWLDGARRRDRALQLVTEADLLAREVAAFRDRAARMRLDAAAALEGVAPHAPAVHKETGWTLQDEAERLEIEAERTEVAWRELLAGALREEPELIEAHTRLADHYAGRHREAEAARDARRAAALEVSLRNHDRGAYTAYLRGDGELVVVTDPPGASVLLHRYVPRGRRVEAVFERALGVTPLRARIGMGSYVLRLLHPDGADVRYPVRIERAGSWSGARPGSDRPAPIRLPRRGELGDDDVYVPAGWFVSGGDPHAAFGLPRRQLWCDAFVVRRFHVTNREYIAFLDDLAATGREEDALRYAPRERSGVKDGEGALIYARDGAGGFVLGADVDGHAWHPDWPVLFVDLEGARAYAAWEAARSALPWRLPYELEWEKAARGVDGRIYPWGDFMDASWCCMTDSHRGVKLPAPVHEWPTDESPYGMRGVAGNARDRCLDLFHAGPAVEGDVVARVAHPGEGSRTLRGGSWGDAAQLARVAERTGVHGSVRGQRLGFRLIRPY